MKKEIKILIFISLAITLFSTFLFFRSQKSYKIVKIGYQPYVVGHSNIILSLKNLKLLEKKGYKIIYIPFLSGPSLNEAIISGKIDIGFAGDLPTISLLAAGAKVKILAANNKSLRQAIVVDKEKSEEIKDLKDLKNKKIALVKGSSSHYFLFKILIENRLNPKLINLIHMDVPNQPLSLIANQVDVIVSWEPWPTKIEKEGIGKIIKKGEYRGYIFAREEFIKNNHQVIQDFIEALQQALEFSQRNLNKTCFWVSKETKENVEIICRAVKTDKIFTIGENLMIDEELKKELNDAARFLFEEGFISRIPNFDEKIDFSFINKVLKK